MTHNHDLVNAMNLARSIMQDCAKLEKSPKGKVAISKALTKAGYDGSFAEFALDNIIDTFEQMMYADKRPFPQALEMYDRLQFLRDGDILKANKSDRRFRDKVRENNGEGVDSKKYVPDFFNMTVDVFGADSAEVKTSVEKWMVLNYMFRQPDVVGPAHDDSAYKRVWFNSAGAFYDRIKELNKDIIKGIKKDFDESEKKRKAGLKGGAKPARPSIKDRIGKGPQALGNNFNGAAGAASRRPKNMPIRKPDEKLIKDKLIKPNPYVVMRAKMRSVVQGMGDDYDVAKRAKTAPKARPDGEPSNPYGNPVSSLDDKVGLDNIKRDLKRMRAVLLRHEVNKKFFPDKFTEEDRSDHAIFVGNPGTGKTITAEALGQICKDVGRLKRGHVVKVERKDLVAGFIGQTAIKTEAEIEKAYDGILFVDEAYALFSESQNDYGHEALEAIMTAMENDRDRLIVIFAGYPDEMAKLVDMNPGLLSRFNKFFEFPDYTDMELGQILDLMMDERSLQFDQNARDSILDGIRDARDTLGRNFGNARFVRNFVEKVEEFQADRLMDAELLTSDMLELDVNDEALKAKLEQSMFTITAEDIAQTLSAMKDARMGKGEPKEKFQMGFHMPHKDANEPAPEV